MAMFKRSLAVISVVALSTFGLVVSSNANMGGTPNSNARGYWTQERMANAQPIELVVDEKTGVGKIQPAGSAKGSGKVTTSGSTTITATTDWPTGAPIAQTAVGKVFFSVLGKNYVCSGSLVKEAITNRAIVLTAGHCAWDQATGTFVSNWAFVPNYDALPSSTPWLASALVVQPLFAAQTSFNKIALANDWAFAVITSTSALPDEGGNSYNLDVSGLVRGNPSFAFGYPAAPPFDGQSLKYAGATIFLDPNTGNTWGMNSTMTGGASGGPWLSNGTSRVGLDYGNFGKLSSLNSYKYNLDSTKMYGPIFNSQTLATFTAATTANSNTKA